MIHKEFWGLLFLAFIGWIFISDSPNERLERVCKPIPWTGNLVTSLSSLVVPQHQVNIKRFSEKVDYGCQYTLWRLIYQEDYNKYVERKKAADAANAVAVPADNSAGSEKEESNETPAPASAPVTIPPSEVPAAPTPASTPGAPESGPPK